MALGCQVSVQDSVNSTPLHVAAGEGHLAAVIELCRLVSGPSPCVARTGCASASGTSPPALPCCVFEIELKTGTKHSTYSKHGLRNPECSWQQAAGPGSIPATQCKTFLCSRNSL